MNDNGSFTDTPAGTPADTFTDTGALLPPAPRVNAMARFPLPVAPVPEINALAAPPLPDADVFPMLTDESAKRDAYVAVVRDGKSVAEASAALGIPERTVRLWASRGRWLRTLEEMVAVSEAEESLRIRRARLGAREADLQTQRETAAAILTNAKAQTGTDLSPQQLKFVAEAAKAASEISNRAHGVTADGAVAGVVTAEFAEKAAEAKTPLVVVVQGGGLPPLRRTEEPRAIDVDTPGDGAV